MSRDVSSETYSTGWVYVLTHHAYPGLVKIGFTTKSVKSRINELERGTGAIPGFECSYAIQVRDPALIERETHRILHNKRKWANKEFFEVTAKKSSTTIKAAILSKNTPVYDEVSSIIEPNDIKIPPHKNTYDHSQIEFISGDDYLNKLAKPKYTYSHYIRDTKKDADENLNYKDKLSRVFGANKNRKL